MKKYFGEYLERKNYQKSLLIIISYRWYLQFGLCHLMKQVKCQLRFFLKFFQNHGLFKLKNRPQWYTVSNRSRTYVQNIISKISGEHFKNYPIKKIKRKTTGIDLYYGGESEYFDYDKVVLATHADEALSIIDNPTDQMKRKAMCFQI